MTYARAGGTEADWRGLAKPMPRQRTTLRVPLRFPHDASDRLFQAVLPGAMEDKWIALPDRGQSTVDFHRSWTGFHVYRVYVARDGDGLSVDRVDVNRDPKQYRGTGDAQDARVVAWLLRALVLEEDVPYPVDPSRRGTDGLLAAWADGGSLAIPPPPDPSLPERPPREPAG